MLQKKKLEHHILDAVRWFRKVRTTRVMLFLLLFYALYYIAVFTAPWYLLPRGPLTYWAHTMGACVICTGNGPWLARTNSGFLIRTANPKYDVYLSRELHYSGVWEAGTTAVVKRLIERQQQAQGTKTSNLVFADCGANMGYFSLLAASSGFDVIAVEMQDTMAHYLASSAALNNGAGRSSSADLGDIGSPVWGEIVIANVALVAKEGEQKEMCYKSSTSNVGGVRAVATGDVEAEKCVPAKTFKALYENSKFQDREIFLMKIDVEGHEEQVLEGAMSLLKDKKIWYLLLEIWSVEPVLQLNRLGYSAYVGENFQEFFPATEQGRKDAEKYYDQGWRRVAQNVLFTLETERVL